MSENQIYSRLNPFIASVKERYRLSKPGSGKNTQHVTLDLSGSGIIYNPGDSIGIYPVNDPHLVEWTLFAMKAKGDEQVTDKHGQSFPLREYLYKKANITEISRKILNEMCQRQHHPQKKEKLEHLTSEGQKEALKEYLEIHEVWDFLEEHSEVHLSPQELCDLLMPLLPRFYSISSSQSTVGDEIHLTVAMLEYETNQTQRRGVCTHYLCNLVPLNEKSVPIYIQPHHGFTVPENKETPMIMIGPGTGIAPFRAFMQERVMQQAIGKNWLFFGEWNEAYDFFYESYWRDLESQGLLKIDTAFSRDQETKLYVQHRIFQQGQEIWNWLSQGAVVYVCGDAGRMAKDVDATLHQIVEHFGKTDPKAYMKQLRQDKRYLRDIY